MGHKLKAEAVVAFVFLFHIPIFFFLSGYLHKIQPNLGEFFRKKSIHLLIPYVAFLVLQFPMEVVHIRQHGGTLSHTIFGLIWGGMRMPGDYSVYWFVPCLFMTQQLMNWLLAKLRLAYVAAVTLGFLLASYLLPLAFHRLDPPLDIHVVLAASPFFLAGFLLKRFPLVDNRWTCIAAFFGVGCAISLILRGVSASYDMRGGNYGIPGVSFVLSLCCILAFIGVGRMIVLLRTLSAALTSFGALSMAIMFVHHPIFVPHRAERLIRPGSFLAFILILIASYVISYAMSLAQWSRAIFLGSEKDLRGLLIRVGLGGGNDERVRKESARGASWV